ncbi:probable glutamate receptor [Procambarus clarkii]|uniref:probable glutamate receptor n=1 Tax=Procambarus clarkii TaxID=6728 RepID=UPI001E670636|nr:probable glutamate receptor [Procambarus clarkii]
MATVTSVLMFLTVTAYLSAAQLPHPHVGEETLRAAGRCVAAVATRFWRPRSSVILLTDGSTSPSTVFTELGCLGAPWGVTVFQVPAEVISSNLTESRMAQVVTHARQVRQVSWLVMVVVVSDDPTFLAASAEWAIKGHLLLWANRLLAITRRPLSDLRHLHTSFSMMNAMLLILDASSRCEMYVHLPYSARDEQPLQVATWSTHHGLALNTRLPLYPDKFSRFVEAPQLVVAAEEFQPHVIVQTRTSALSFLGPMAEALHLLARSLNFTYTFLRPPDGSWGVKLPDGSWTGMVGMVGRKEADIGLGPFAVTSVRAEMVDFTYPILVDYGRILARRGRPEVDPWSFLLPFTPEVWVGTLAVLLLVLSTVAVMQRCSARMTAPRDRWLGDTLFTYSRVLLQQDARGCSRLWWERLVLGGWMLLMLVLTRSYSGTLTSILAVRYVPEPFQTLRALLDSPRVTLVWEANTMYVQYFRSVDSGIFREVMDSEKAGRIKYVKSTEYTYMRDHLVRQGKHVFLGEDLSSKVLMAQDFSNTGACDFYTSRDKFLPFMFAMIGQKESPLVPALSQRIQTMTEAGLYWHWLENMIPNSTSCVRAASKIFVESPLQIPNLWGVFVVLAGGHIVALLGFGSELLTAPLH